MSLWHVSNGYITPDGVPFWVYVVALDAGQAEDLAREIFRKHAERHSRDVNVWTATMIVSRASPVILVPGY